MFLGVRVERIQRGLFYFNCSKGAQTGLCWSLAGGGQAGMGGWGRRSPGGGSINSSPRLALFLWRTAGGISKWWSCWIMANYILKPVSAIRTREKTLVQICTCVSMTTTPNVDWSSTAPKVFRYGAAVYTCVSTAAVFCWGAHCYSEIAGEVRYMKGRCKTSFTFTLICPIVPSLHWLVWITWCTTQVLLAVAEEPQKSICNWPFIFSISSEGASSNLFLGVGTILHTIVIPDTDYIVSNVAKIAT